MGRDAGVILEQSRSCTKPMFPPRTIGEPHIWPGRHATMALYLSPGGAELRWVSESLVVIEDKEKEESQDAELDGVRDNDTPKVHVPCILAPYTQGE